MRSKKKELILGIGIRIFGGILIDTLLIYLSFVVWRDFTNLDVLYLVGFHFVAWNWVLMFIMDMAIESAKRFAKRWWTRQQILNKYKRG